MTDIVERLRREATRFAAMDTAAERPWVADAAWAADHFNAAADEIERLRAEIVLLEATGPEAADEIERLRAALLKAEMEVEIASVEIIGRAVDIGHRRGIRAALKVCDERMHAYRAGTPTDGTMAAIEEISDLIGHIRALLKESKR